jgi:hypothetical protein
MPQNTPSPSPSNESTRITLPGSPFGIAAGFLYGYHGVPAYDFMPVIRELHGGFTKVYLFWNQVEPEKDRYDWTAVDKILRQLQSPDEALVAVFSSSQWATRTPSAMLPPSPAKDQVDYRRFIEALVGHCKGRVRYWQNDAEPNSPIYWSGSREEYVTQLRSFHLAVKSADPAAVVVVGGYDGLFGPPGTHPFPNQQAGLDFFDYVLDQGRDAFDVFDLRLYADPYTIVSRVDFMREKMRALGYLKPIISTEYGGPSLFEFAENRQYIPLVASWSQAVASPDDKGQPSPDHAARKQIKALYDQMATLAPQTQMFLQGCPPNLNARYHRIQARGLVMRNLFALAAGVQKSLYWYLPAFPAEGDARYDLMALMYGKIGMVEPRADGLKKYPNAEAFQRMARALTGVQRVRRLELSGKPEIFAFEVERGPAGPVCVVWERRDALAGEDAPLTPIEIPWAASGADAEDALGQAVEVKVKDGRARLPVSVTPVFIEPVR